MDLEKYFCFPVDYEVVWWLKADVEWNKDSTNFVLFTTVFPPEPEQLSSSQQYVDSKQTHSLTCQGNR